MSVLDPITSKAYAWSGRFRLDHVDEFIVKIKREKNSTSVIDAYYIRVTITLDGTTVLIRLQKDDMKNPIYKIDNLTNHEINYRQKNSNEDKNDRRSENYFMKLKPGHSMAFTWDDFVFNKLLEIEVENRRAEYNLDTIKDYDPIPLD
mmetsp:Transcript_33854/g.30656  ORF Transcript_33854/g.30656 Transcript_33854/m.30656 type:complete len:148 (+) Transcript_33854:402-845(+)